MNEFKVIETQEEFDKAIKSRLAQKDRELEEKFKDYLAPDKVSALNEEYEKIMEAKRNVIDVNIASKEGESINE